MDYDMFRKQKLPMSCQLIAAVNARIFLGGKDLSDEAYDALVDVACCRVDPAINMLVVEELLGIQREEVFFNHWIFAEVGLPIAFNIETREKGRHMVLVVGVDPELHNGDWQYHVINIEGGQKRMPYNDLMEAHFKLSYRVCIRYFQRD